MENKIVKVYVLKGLNGISLVIENYRVSDEKIYGMLTPIYTFDVATDDILQAIGISTADVLERSEVDKAIEESYKKGLTDAWKCARKIGNNSQLGLEGMGFDFSELGTYYNPSWWVVFNYDVFKALEILKRNIGE